MKNINFTFSAKQEAQYRKLRAKFYISRAEYYQYYIDIRRANRKGRALRKRDDAVYIPEYSYNLETVLTSRKLFKQHQASVHRVLRRDYRLYTQDYYKARFYSNLISTFGFNAASAVIEVFNKMNATDYAQWIQENPNLNYMVFDSKPQEIARYLKHTAELFVATVK